MRATPLLFPATGVAHYIRSLASELNAAGENLTLFTPFRWGLDPHREAASAGPSASSLRRTFLRAVPRPRQAARLVESALLAANARLRRVSLYHEPATFPLPFAGRTVVTVHDLSWIRYPQTHPEDRRRTLERDFPALLRNASHVLTDSAFVKSELISEFGLREADITTAPLAARAAFFPRDRRDSAVLLERLRLRYRSFFLSVGTLEPRKNLVRTLRAYASLPAQVRQNNPLILVGGAGWESEDIETEIKTLASRGEIIALGYVPDDELALLYSAAKALVYASLYEGFGLPPLEAMASGTPVIAASAASLPEVVGTAGLLVNPLDEVEIREAMWRLAEDEALAATLCARGFERSKLFSWTSCAALTRGVYHQVLQRQ